jgi:hypothetical protein
MPLRILDDSDPGLTIAAMGNVLCCRMRAVLTESRVATLRRCDFAFAKELRAKFAILSIIEVEPSEVLAFQSGARDAAVALTHEIGPLVHCNAVVFDRTGFVASTLRSIVTTVNLLSRKAFPMRVFGELMPALEWMGEKLDGHGGLDAPKLAAALAEWRK